jgi:hypothetical protein
MKTLIRLSILTALASLFALSAFGQAPAAPANPCEEAARGELYTKYYNEKKTDQAAAYKTAKEYLAKYESCNDQYSNAVKKFADAYAGATLKVDFFKAVNSNDIAKVNDLGQQLLSANSNDAIISLGMAVANYKALGAKNPAANRDATLAAVSRTISLIEAGNEPKTLDNKVDWAPFGSKDDALSYLNYWVGALNFESNPTEAVTRFVKVAQSPGKSKEDPQLYYNLVLLYEKEREKLAAEYATIKEENDQSRLLLANINRIVDQQIDALARAVAYAPANHPNRAEWMTALTTLYKSRNNDSDAGLQAKIDAIKATPLLVTAPITTPPPAANGTTPQPGPTAEKKP